MKVKAWFDFLVALLLFPFLLPVLLILILVATFDTGEFGLFTQIRIGKNAKPFSIYKIRTMKGKCESDVTTENSHNITPIGRFLRKSKLDELPQILNLILGQMSFVGPRPDVPGYADLLEENDRIVLSVKPGITGPAQLAFKNEEEVLNQQKDPLKYNNEVLWPQKVEINKEYIRNWSFISDLNYIFKTVF